MQTKQEHLFAVVNYINTQILQAIADVHHYSGNNVINFSADDIEDLSRFPEMQEFIDKINGEAKFKTRY
jgi:hypothetical protein